MSYPRQGQDPSKMAGDPAYPPGQYPPPPQYSQQLHAGGANVGMYPQAQQYTMNQAQMPAHSYPQAYPGPAMPGAPPPYAYQPQMQHPVQGGYPVQAYPQQAYMGQAPQVYATAQFDSGARFDGISSQNIPPPPPGCAPNAAQMAASQGGVVHATQKKDNWFTGGKGGGVSFW